MSRAAAKDEIPAGAPDAAESAPPAPVASAPEQARVVATLSSGMAATASAAEGSSSTGPPPSKRRMMTTDLSDRHIQLCAQDAILAVQQRVVG